MAGVASDVRIGILGPLEVRVGFGEPVEVVGRRLRRLLIRLAIDPDRMVLASQLVDAVWDEDPPAGATNALQSLVSRLRRLLPDAVESDSVGYRLALEPDAVDAIRFEALARAGREELRRDPRQAGDTLREALALWRGPALADAAAAHFAKAAVARLEELRLGALEDRIEADLATGGDEALVAELDQLVTTLPLRERLCGQLMRALARAGRQADALAAYERLRARLADDLGIDPSEELKAVHVAVLRGETSASATLAPPPPDRAPAAARTNLRAQITSFVGRADDIARITSVFSEARLVTLTGPGGAGKTRLASEAAARMLATSREPLRITGEVLHPVGPLAMPDEDVTPAEALRYPAVRLFADRGAAARRAFVVDGTTLPPVLRICRALDGIPLAIELAAARLHALAPEQIAARLDDRFRLLVGGSRPVLPRHQTLRAVVDWSWDLLGDAERVLARRLAVFSGGATLAAIERVCARPDLGGLAADEVLYLLAALVEKSLVVASEDSGEPRYPMLETVRAYGEERRRAAGEDQALRRAHAVYFLDLAERADPELRRRDQLTWLGRLSAERDNLHAALRWAVDSRDAALALRLVASLGWYWFLRSARAEAIEWSAQALALPGEAPPAVRAQVLAGCAFIAMSGGWDFARSFESLETALEIVRGLPGDERLLSHPTLAIVPALSPLFRNDDTAALEHARELSDHPDPWVRALMHSMVGGLLINLGEAGSAASELELGLAGFQALGERWGVGQVLITRAELDATRSRHEVAVAALREAMEVFIGLGDREDIGQIMIRLAQEHAQAGEIEQAREDLALADRIAHEVGAEDQKIFIRYTRGDIARWQGRLDEARELIDGAIEDFGRGGGFPIGQRHAILLSSRGHLDVAAGDLDGALVWYQRALLHAVESHDRPVIARVVELLADVALGGGDAERAAVLLGTAEALRGMPDEADVDLLRVRAAARAALGDEGFAQAYRRGAARRRDELLAELSAEVRSAAETPAARAGRTPPR